MICLLGCLEICASNLLEHELQPEIQGSQHPEPSAKGKRDPRIFFGVNTLSHIFAIFFETGAMATPTKSQNSTILGQGILDSTQWSHTSRFNIGSLSLATMATFDLRALHKTNSCLSIVISISCELRLKKTI